MIGKVVENQIAYCGTLNTFVRKIVVENENHECQTVMMDYYEAQLVKPSDVVEVTEEEVIWSPNIQSD